MLACSLKRTACALIAGVACLTAVAAAQTVKLELKPLKDQQRFRESADALFRMTSAQSFYMNRDEGDRAKQRDEEFAAVIKKQPEKYECEFPFRGVAKLGSQKFGWVLDSTKSESGYNRLYFDFNCNGDLTDDKVVEGSKERGGFGGGYASFQFPRTELAIDVDGKKLDYAFFLSGYAYGLEQGKKPQYAQVAFNPAVYREGKVTLDGKEHRIVLLDFNSSGKFNDPFTVDTNVGSPRDQLYSTDGDMLLVDPDTRNSDSYGYGLTDRRERMPVSKLVCIAEKYYEMKITPTGDELTLTAYKGAVAPAVNGNCDRYEAVIFGDGGMLKVGGEKDKPVMLPVGEWRLLSYSINGAPRPATKPVAQTTPAESKDKDAATKPAAKPKGLLAKAVRSWLGSTDAEDGEEDGSSGFAIRTRYTLASANATKATASFKVQEGRTTFMKFGPPYKPSVKVGYWRDKDEAYLTLAITGTGGEVLNNLMVNGDRPKAPSFQIINPAGEIVLRGKFEFG